MSSIVVVVHLVDAMECVTLRWPNFESASPTRQRTVMKLSNHPRLTSTQSGASFLLNARRRRAFVKSLNQQKKNIILYFRDI